MALSIRAFANSDDTLIVWRSDSPIPDCVGFELIRRLNGVETVLKNRISFSGGTPDPSAPESSATSPFRRYAWVDHEVNAGDTVSYRAVPVIQAGTGPAKPDASSASPFTKEIAMTGRVDGVFECYFNRGLLISQFMSRYLKGDLSAASLAAFKKSLNASKESQMRIFLGGDLRVRLLDLLDDASLHIYAALFELSDAALIARLKKLKKRAHIVLANGPHRSRTEDANSCARASLRKAGCEVLDRMLPSNALGHNKFMVITDKDGNPRSAWTGSTNWSPTGLCTQINNGLLVNDPGVARIYLDQWNRLKAAGDDVPTSLVSSNSSMKPASVPPSRVEVWFTRTSKGQEMQSVVELVSGAQQGIVFLMFMPGRSPILSAVLARQKQDPHLFVKGVVSTLDASVKNARITLVTKGTKTNHSFPVVEPTGLGGVGAWAAEVSRSLFLSKVGFAIVHSKVIVIDPSGVDPVVITGSHNFSTSASSRNDENLVIIKGNAALAQAYALSVQSVFDHYSFRDVAMAMKVQGKSVADLMKDPKSWQKSWFMGDKRNELDFWMGP